MVPLETATPISGIMRTFVDGKGSVEAAQIYSKLLVKKNASHQLLGVVVSYLPDRKYWQENDCGINTLGYELEGTNFSGIYMVSSLDGKMIHGAKFDKGELLFRFYPNWRKDINKEHECQHTDSAEHEACQVKYRLHIELLDASHNVLTRSANTEGGNLTCMFCGQDPMYCDCIIIDANRICGVCHNEIVNGRCRCCSICRNSPCRCCHACDKYPCICPNTGGNTGGGNSGGTTDGGGNTGSGNTGGGTSGSTGGGGSSTSSVFTQAQIKSAAKKAVNKVLDDHNNDTITAHCNEGVRNAFYELFNSKALYGMRANDMVKYWKDNPSKWEKIEMKDAQKKANEGSFVVAGWINTKVGRSGHVVVIVPGTETYSKGWECNVPCSMDTGYKMKEEKQKLNESFGKDKKDDIVFFKYK